MTIITAIPMKDDHIAGHFAKAERFVFIDEQGTTLKEISNPIAPNECKGMLADLFRTHGANRVVLKNIGKKMLKKLLDNGLSVYQALQGRLAISKMLKNDSTSLIQLVSADQGQESACSHGQRHQREIANSCGEHEHGHSGKKGCGKAGSAQRHQCQGAAQPHAHKRCCEE